MESALPQPYALKCYIYLHITFPFSSTLTSSTGYKTRNSGTIIKEIIECLRIHAACNSKLGGISLEFTGEFNDEGFSVTECLGGSMELTEDELELRYQVWVLGALLSSPASDTICVDFLRPQTKL